MESGVLYDSLLRVLYAWRQGLVTDREVVAWADQAISERPPEQIPNWLCSLSLYGPSHCSSLPAWEFVQTPDPPFADRVTIQARCTALNSRDSMARLIRWWARACIGLELDDPDVATGYSLDQFLDYSTVDEASRWLLSEGALETRARVAAHGVDWILESRLPDCRGSA